MPGKDGVDPLAPLRSEHRRILRQLGLIQRAAGDGRPEPARLRKLANQLGGMLNSHFTHERAVLCRPLSSQTGPANPTDSLVEQHDAIRLAFKRLMSALEIGGPPELRVRLTSLSSTISDYVRKEEKIVFWLAELNLGRAHSLSGRPSLEATCKRSS